MQETIDGMPVPDRGRIDIDLPRALRDPDSRDNVILQPGDAIAVFGEPGGAH